MEPFEALVVDQTGDKVSAEIREMTVNDLPPGELLIQVKYTSVNYKDALACIPNGNIVKRYPFIPGIDLAGVVAASTHGDFREGDEVLVTGYELGVTHFGGFSGFARVPAGWAVRLPQGLTLKEAMIYGTAGFTAALSVQALQESGIRPEDGPVLVTGATGGVGSVAVSIFAELGYEVAASTGKADLDTYLLGLGANRVIPRDKLIPEKLRPLDKQLWAGAVDCVGGRTLSAILSSMKYGGAVAASGLTGGAELSVTVYPFILRGVRLIGIDSVNTSMEKRKQIWELLSSHFKPAGLHDLHNEISLSQVPDAVQRILQGQSIGRTVVAIQKPEP